MVVTSSVKLEINKIYDQNSFKHFGFEMPDGEWHFIFRFLVIREASLEELHEYIISLGYEPSYLIPHEFFYLISID